MDRPDFNKLWDFDDLATSATRFKEVMAIAEAEHDTGIYLEAKTQLARTFSLQMQMDTAKQLLAEVQAELTDDQLAARIRYQLELGRCFNSSGQQAEALPYFTRAMELAQTAAEAYLEIDAIHMLGIAAADPVEQINWNKVALEKIEASQGETYDEIKHWLGPLYNNTAWSLCDLGKIVEAKQLFEKDYSYRLSIGRPEKALISKWSIAAMERKLGNFDTALSLQLEIMHEREEQGLSPGGYNHEELGELYLQQGNREQAAKHFALAYEVLSQDEWLKQHEADRLQRIMELSTAT